MLIGICIKLCIYIGLCKLTYMFAYLYERFKVYKRCVCICLL